MVLRHSSIPFVAVLCLGLFGFAFVAAPRSCEWGLTAYFWSGVAVVLAFIAMPAVRGMGRTIPTRVLFSLGLGALGSAVWFGGLVIANVRIMCRLF